MATYVHNPNCLTPDMTSNTTPAPVVITSSTAPYGFMSPWMAFTRDGSSSTWTTNAGSASWLRVDCGLLDGNGWEVTSYTVTASGDQLSGSPKDWTIVGSRDNGVTWTTLGTVTGQTAWTTNEMRTYQVAFPGVYLSYKINITANNGSDATEIGELELIGSVKALPPFKQWGYEATSLPMLTGNQIPSPYIASASSELDTSHQAYVAFDKSGISGCWQSSGSPNASWLQLYVGTTALSVSRYEISAPIDPSLCSSMPQSWVFQGSADGITNWATMDTQTNQTGWNASERRTFCAFYAPSLLYFRITVSQNNGGANVCIAELNISTTYVHNPNCLTPDMTSNTTPAPVVITSSTAPYSPMLPWMAFTRDGSGSTWATNAGSASWLRVDCGLLDGNGWEVTSYTVTASGDQLSGSPKDWTIVGSRDNGVTWTTLGTVTGQTAWTTNEMRTYQVAFPGVYLSYKINITANNGSNATEIGELELIGSVQSLYSTTTEVSASSSASGSSASDSYFAHVQYGSGEVLGIGVSVSDAIFDSADTGAIGQADVWVQTPHDSADGADASQADGWTSPTRDSVFARGIGDVDAHLQTMVAGAESLDGAAASAAGNFELIKIASDVTGTPVVSDGDLVLSSSLISTLGKDVSSADKLVVNVIRNGVAVSARAVISVSGGKEILVDTATASGGVSAYASIGYAGVVDIAGMAADVSAVDAYDLHCDCLVMADDASIGDGHIVVTTAVDAGVSLAGDVIASDSHIIVVTDMDMGLSAAVVSDVADAVQITISDVDGDTSLSGAFVLSDAWAELNRGITMGLASAVADAISLHDVIAVRDVAVRRYYCTLTGGQNHLPDVLLPISSFQCRMNQGASSYVSVVIPGMAWNADIAARPNGEIVIAMALIYAGAEVIRQEIARVAFETIRADRGAKSQSVTLTGHKTTTWPGGNTVVLRGASYIEIGETGKASVRCAEPDIFLRPGDICQYDQMTSFIANSVQYVVSPRTQTMTVSE